MVEKKTQGMKYLRGAFWFLALFGLVSITALMLWRLGLVDNPLGLGDCFVVLLIDIVVVILAIEWRRFLNG